MILNLDPSLLFTGTSQINMFTMEDKIMEVYIRLLDGTTVLVPN